jgi:hypothetical protein
MDETSGGSSDDETSAVGGQSLRGSSIEIDGACQHITTDGFDFSFTTAKTASAASSFGDFGGTWNNTWISLGVGGGTFPCKLDFSGNSITTTCPVGTKDEVFSGSPLAGITFNYDGADTVSGVVQAWAEFSATRR